MKRIITLTIAPTALIGGLPDNLALVMLAYSSSNKLDKANQELSKLSPAWAFLPVKAGINRGRRRALMQKMLTGKARPSKVLSLSPIMSLLIPTVAGSVIGGLANGSSLHDKLLGVAAGAAAGASIGGAAHLLAYIMAAITGKRSLQEQSNYEQSAASTVGNYLVPGMAPYNYWKSVGVLNSDLYEDALNKSYESKKI